MTLLKEIRRLRLKGQGKTGKDRGINRRTPESRKRNMDSGSTRGRDFPGAKAATLLIFTHEKSSLINS